MPSDYVVTKEYARVLPVSWERVLVLPVLLEWCIILYLSLPLINLLLLFPRLHTPLFSAPFKLLFSWFSIFLHPCFLPFDQVFVTFVFSLTPLPCLCYPFLSSLCLFAASSVNSSLLPECQSPVKEERQGGRERQRWETRSGSTHLHTCSSFTAETNAPHKSTRGKKDEHNAPAMLFLDVLRECWYFFPLHLVCSPQLFLLNPSQIKANLGIGGRDGCWDTAIEEKCLSASGKKKRREGEKWLLLHLPSAHSWDWEQTQRTHSQTGSLTFPPPSPSSTTPRDGGGRKDTSGS